MSKILLKGEKHAIQRLKTTISSIKKDMDGAMIKVATYCNFISGAQVAELEKELAEYVGVKHCITCANGTDTLSLAMMK